MTKVRLELGCTGDGLMLLTFSSLLFSSIYVPSPPQRFPCWANRGELSTTGENSGRNRVRKHKMR
ncbi:uncharacterized protein DS421_12g361500 [Arachis hypogaea]|nr:uncharacterized protein DS421_12g361500 [Arachis hypogaea]